jgi:uncharacterized protein YjiS (DUF1127 family)
MSIESVRAFFAEKAPEIAVIESTMSSATVTLAAEAYGVEPARIAKTLSLRIGERVVLIVAAGTSRMDNKKVKAQFGGKPKMLGLDPPIALAETDAAGPTAASTRNVLGLLRRYWRAFQQRRQLQSLADLSDRQLLDIGLTRGEIDCITPQRAIDRIRDSAMYLSAPW